MESQNASIDKAAVAGFFFSITGFLLPLTLAFFENVVGSFAQAIIFAPLLSGGACILGIVGLVRIHQGKKRGKILAWCAIIIGFLALILIVGVCYTFGLPGCVRLGIPHI